MKAKKSIKFSIIAGLFMAALFFSGCKDKNQDIIGSWKVKSLEKNGVYQEICVSDINIEKGSGSTYAVHGNSGINSFFGNVKVKAGSFKADDKMASTRMAGAPAEMEYEDNFLLCLTGADKIEIVTENGIQLLKLTNTSAGLILTFSK